MIKRSFLLIALFLFPILLFGQDGGASINFNEMFATFAGYLAGVTILTGIWKSLISDKNTFIVSIVISTIGAAAGFLLKLGIFATLEWWGALIYDVGVILIVKGFVSIDMIIAILNLFKIGPNNQTK